MVDPLNIIEKFYPRQSRLYNLLVDHSRVVTQKSLEIAKKVIHLEPDIEFIKKAAMLHDIGIFMTRADSIGCTGKAPYICHGVLGRRLLDEQGLPLEYGLVCERHTGAGITLQNILSNKLPLPKRDMVPVTLEEKIICAADKYYSKDKGCAPPAITTSQVVENLKKIDPGHAKRFSLWVKELNL